MKTLLLEFGHSFFFENIHKLLKYVPKRDEYAKLDWIVFNPYKRNNLSNNQTIEDMLFHKEIGQTELVKEKYLEQWDDKSIIIRSDGCNIIKLNKILKHFIRKDYKIIMLSDVYDKSSFRTKYNIFVSRTTDDKQIEQLYHQSINNMPFVIPLLDEFYVFDHSMITDATSYTSQFMYASYKNSIVFKTYVFNFKKKKKEELAQNGMKALTQYFEKYIYDQFDAEFFLEQIRTINPQVPKEQLLSLFYSFGYPNLAIIYCEEIALYWSNILNKDKKPFIEELKIIIGNKNADYYVHLFNDKNTKHFSLIGELVNYLQQKTKQIKN